MIIKIALAFATATMATLAWSADLSIPVLAKDQSKGTVLTAAMLSEKSLPESYLTSNTARMSDEVIGLELTRPYRAGMAIYTNALRIPPLVEKNKQVEVQFEKAGFNLSLSARALEDGLEGDMIRVENTSSHQVIFAEVVGNGKVVIR